VWAGDLLVLEKKKKNVNKAAYQFDLQPKQMRVGKDAYLLGPEPRVEGDGKVTDGFQKKGGGGGEPKFELVRLRRNNLKQSAEEYGCNRRSQP